MAYSDAGERTTTQTLLDAVLAISSNLDLHSVLDTIVESCCAVSGARYGFLGVLGDDGDLVDYVVHGLTDDEVKELVDVPAASGLIGHLIRHPHALRLARVSDHPAGDSLPVPHRPTDSFLGMPLRVGDAVFGNLYLTGKAGDGEFTREDEALVEALARVAGVAVDNARAYNLSERRREWVEATALVTDSLHPPFRLDETLRQIVTGVRRVSRASLAVVMHGRPGDWTVAAADGPRYATLTGVLEEAGGHLVAARETGRPVVARHGEEGTLVVVPFEADLSYEGVLLLLLDHGRGSFPAAEREVLAAYAAQASLALDRVESGAARQEMLLVADRDRIARDLHDLVIQRLFATGLQLQGGRRLTDLRELHSRLESAVTDLDHTIRDIRTVIFELEHGNDDTLRTNIGTLVREYVPVLGFTPELATTGPVDSLVGPQLGEHVLAVLREALSNCARHAQATSCRIGIDVDREVLVVSVVDDGIGTGAGLRESGLRNLRRRAEQLGGALRVRAASPRGTALEWRVPVQP